MAEETKKSWLRHQHPEYERNAGRWKFTQEAYTGDLLDSDRITNYLVQKSQSESVDAYKERCNLADYTGHFSTLVDELAGMIFAVESKANRIFEDEEGNGLGNPENTESVMGRLYQDADGRGNGWLTLFKQIAIELIHSFKCWIICDSTSDTPLIRMFPALSVSNWRYDSLGLAEVVVKEQADIRKSIQEGPGLEDRFVVYTREGWKRYKILTAQNGDESEMILDEDTYIRGFEAPDRAPALPIYPISLPMPRPIGWLMAKKAVAMFNRESERDNLLRVANFPFLNIFAEDELYNSICDAIKKGTKALQNPPDGKGHAFIAPDPGPATVATDVLKRKVEEFYITGFREYGDAARQKTATEVRHEVAAGVGSFLQMLKAALDDAENGALWRVAQIEFDERAKWFVGRVERSEDFAIEDPQQVAKRLTERYMGKDRPLPVGKTGIESLVRQLAAADGITLDDAEMKAAVNLFTIQQAQGAISTFPIPAEARAELAVKFLVGIGYLDPEEEVELEDGDKKMKRDVVYEKALVIAEAQDQRDRDFLAGAGGLFGGNA